MKSFKYLVLGTVLAACGPSGSGSRLQVARPYDAPDDVKSLGDYVVSLENKGMEFCTGVLVAKDIVLTAAHCFLREKVLTDLRARTGSDHYAIRSLRTLADREGKVSDDYFPNYDVAILEIDPVDAPLEKFPKLMSGTEAQKFVGQDAWLAGYGMTASGAADMGSLRFGRAPIKRASGTGRYTGLLVVDSAAQSGPCAGDSGGPLFVKQDKDWLVAGLVHGVNWYANPSFFGEDPCAFEEATYVMPGSFIHPETLAREGRVQMIDPPQAAVDLDWMDLCEVQPLTRDELPTFKILTLKFRFKSCAEIQQAFLQKPIALDFGTSPLRSVQILSRIPISSLKADLSQVETPGQALRYLENATATVSTQNQLNFILEAQGLKKLNLVQKESVDLDYGRLNQHTGLIDLRLNGMQITKLPHLAPLKKLRHLELSLNALENLDFLKGTESLEYLNVSSNRLASISGLVDSKQLSILILSNNRITDISTLKQLPAMQQLSLVNNPIPNKICPYFEEQEGDICAF